MIDNKQKKSENSSMSATNFVMYQKMKQSGSRYSERVTMKEEDSYHHALAREYFHLGNQHQKSKEYKLSINFFLTALKYKYDSPEIHNNIGVAYVLNTEYKKAEQSFNKSIQNKLSQIFPKINLANLKFKQDKFTAGIQIFLQLLSVDKDRRIINHFNKVLVSHNNLYRFFKLNFIASHPNIDKRTLQITTTQFMEDINKKSPIMIQLQDQLALSNSQIQEIQKLFNIIRFKYSSLKPIKNRSELSQACVHGDELIKCIQGLKSQKASNITKLLFMYVFMEEQKTDLSLYFYSLIDKFQNKQISKEYAQLYDNYLKIKNEQNMPFHRHYSVTIENQSSEQRRQIIESIQRFFFIENLPIFRLHQLRNWNSLPDGKRTLQILGKTFWGLQNYQQLSALAFYQCQRYGNTFDYNLQAALVQYFVHKNKDLDSGRDMILSVAQNSLNDGDYYSQDEKFKHFQWVITIIVLRQQFQKAIQICNKKIAQFPNREDKIEQYIGSIYFSAHHFQKAIQHLEISHRLNPNNHDTNFKLACIYFQELCQRRSHAKELYEISQYQECFPTELSKIMQIKYQQCLQYILHAISINPIKVKHYYLLEMLYQYSYYKDEKITLYLDKLLEESNRPNDFKARANIALFNAMVFQYDKSYYYFREILQKGLSESDTNCQDLELFYFIRKCCDTAHLLTKKYGEFGWVTQIGIYLVIFYYTSKLFDKYDEYSHQLDTQYFQYINGHFARAIQFPDQLINRLERLDNNHKQIIYRYIFNSENLKKNAVDLIRLYEKITQFQQLRYSLFYLEIQVSLKQYKMAALKEILDYIISFENSMARNKYFNKSYLVLLSELIKDQYQIPTKVQKNWTDVKFYTKFTYYTAATNPQLLLHVKFLDKKSYQLTSSELQSIVFSSISKICHQHMKFRRLHKDKKKFRANTLYQGIVLLSIEEVLPYISQNSHQQTMLAANCQQFLINRNISEFHTKIISHLYEKEDSSENQSVFSPFPETSVLGESKISNLSERSSSQGLEMQKCLQYKYPQYNDSPQKDAQNENLCNLQYGQMMKAHLKQENILQLLSQINKQAGRDDKGGNCRLNLLKQIVKFIKNCEELDILVINLDKKCDKQNYKFFSIQCSQLIKIGTTDKKQASDNRLFEYTCVILKEIMKLQQKQNKFSLSQERGPFILLLQDEFLCRRQQKGFKEQDVTQFLKVIKNKLTKYHLKMLQDIYKQYFSQQYYYSKKLKFYMKLLIGQKMNYEKFLRLVQAKIRPIFDSQWNHTQ